jgi:hypothetical protein
MNSSLLDPTINGAHAEFNFKYRKPLLAEPPQIRIRISHGIYPGADPLPCLREPQRLGAVAKKNFWKFFQIFS